MVGEDHSVLICHMLTFFSFIPRMTLKKLERNLKKNKRFLNFKLLSPAKISIKGVKMKNRIIKKNYEVDSE